MDKLDIKAPDGYEIDQENSDLSTGVIRFKEKSKGLVKSWEDLDKIEGYYVDTYANIYEAKGDLAIRGTSQQTWATKEQAEASIAMAMLSQLMKQANGDWTPAWGYDDTKYVLYHAREKIVEDVSFDVHSFLAFKSKEIRDEFLELHRDLIEKAKPLL